MLAAARTSVDGFGETTRIFVTPATCAGITVMSTVETSG
jgi:hypothetical protein